MAGMPSAYGGEWRGRGESRRLYEENYGKINWDDNVKKSGKKEEKNADTSD